MSPSLTSSSSSNNNRFYLIPLSIVLVLLLVSLGASKKIKCQDDECQMKTEHFKVYSTVKRALDKNFHIKGKDLISLIRSVEILRRRFGSPEANKQPGGTANKLNGTELVQRLLANKRLSEAMEVFESAEGRQLVNLYKTSINGNQQNLACSKWRVNEIEFAAKKLEQDSKLAGVFKNIHKNFVERSARKCLKSSCSSIDDNMNRFDSVVRKASRRKGFLAHDEVLPFEPTTATTTTRQAATTTNGSLPASDEPPTGGDGSSIDDALIAQLENEPPSEFQAEESELCRFFKRTNATNCQASGNELSEISFATPATASNQTAAANGRDKLSSASLADYLADYEKNRRREPDDDDRQQAQRSVLAQCDTIRPMLDYHLFGLRWYQQAGLISADKLRMRTFWCPSLTYWLEIDRLCSELKSNLNLTKVGDLTSVTYTY
jgi:hypothetical protein